MLTFALFPNDSLRRVTSLRDFAVISTNGVYFQIFYFHRFLSPYQVPCHKSQRRTAESLLPKLDKMHIFSESFCPHASLVSSISVDNKILDCGRAFYWDSPWRVSADNCQSVWMWFYPRAVFPLKCCLPSSVDFAGKMLFVCDMCLPATDEQTLVENAVNAKKLVFQEENKPYPN